MDWIDVDKELPEAKFKKYLVKKEYGDPISAFFMPDKIMWIDFYGIKPSYWMAVDTGELIHDVKYWMEIPKKIKQDLSEASPTSY